MKDEYIQIGQTALRDPASGEYLPAVPMFARGADLGSAGASGKLSAAEMALRDVGDLFAKNMKKYVEGVGAVETARRKVGRA